MTTLAETLAAAPGALTRYRVGTLAVRTRRRAWTENPHCLSCGAKTLDPEQTGLVRTVHGDRVACRDDCFVAAILDLPSVGATAGRS